MATVSITFTGADKNPYFPADNASGGNFTSRGAADAALFSNAIYGLNASANTIWSCDVDPVVNTFSAQTVFDTVDSNSRGIVVFNSSGNGFMFIARSTDVRVFALAAWVLSGVALATYTTSFSTGGILNVDVTQSTGSYVVKNNATTLGTYTNATYTSGLKAGLVSRGIGRIRSFTLTYTPAFTIDTLTSPLVPNSAFSGTSTGFSDGAATLSFSGASVGVTIASGAFSGTVPMIADNVSWPKLPATSQTITLTQSSNSAAISRDISLPTGYDTVRDGSSAVANFAGIVSDDNTYLQYWFNAAGNPLTTNDTAVFPTSSSYNIYQDTGVSASTSSLPRTDVIYIYRGVSGKYFEHTVILTDAGIGGITGLTSNGLTVSGLTTTGITRAGL